MDRSNRPTASCRSLWSLCWLPISFHCLSLPFYQPSRDWRKFLPWLYWVIIYIFSWNIFINRVWGTYNDPPTSSEVHLLMTEGDLCPNDISRETEVSLFLVFRDFIPSLSFHAIPLFYLPSTLVPFKKCKLATTSSRPRLPSFANSKKTPRLPNLLKMFQCKQSWKITPK